MMETISTALPRDAWTNNDVKIISWRLRHAVKVFRMLQEKQLKLLVQKTLGEH
jgi:hypothetical protein